MLPEPNARLDISQVLSEKAFKLIEPKEHKVAKEPEVKKRAKAAQTPRKKEPYLKTDRSPSLNDDSKEDTSEEIVSYKAKKHRNHENRNYISIKSMSLSPERNSRNGKSGLADNNQDEDSEGSENESIQNSDDGIFLSFLRLSSKLIRAFLMPTAKPRLR